MLHASGKTTIGFLVITGLLLMSTGNSAAGNKITIHPETLVTGTKVYLRDIATIEGSLNAIKNLGNILICSAPSPRKTRSISSSLIKSRLRRADCIGENCPLDCPDRVQVKSDYIEYSRTDIEAIIKKHIYKNISWNKHQVEIKNIFCKPVVLPRGRVSYSFNPAERDKSFIANYHDEILFCVDNDYKKKIHISARINVVCPVVVATRTIERNTVIQHQDLKLAMREITTCSDHIHTNLESVIGKSTRIRIDAYTMIRDKMVVAAPAVHKGDPVTIFLENRFIKLTVPGKALQRGAVGETIKVTNISSDQDIYAVVRSSKNVEVMFR